MSDCLPHITVCVCTYKRPHLLERALESLVKQQTSDLFTYSIVVTDNDRGESARDVVLRFATSSGLEINYTVEAEQNIALARNTALANAKGDYIAFIDDDEFAPATWLHTLYKACLKFEADGCLGPVHPWFDKNPPRWVTRGRFFERTRHQSGFVIDFNEGRTGNVLIKKSILPRTNEVFRREFGSGGEDRDFFRRMISQGNTFVWCDEGLVYEVIPPSRWSKTVMLRRALLRGKMSLVQHRTGLRAVGVSLIAVFVYSVALPFLLVTGFHRFMTYLIKLCDHGGRVFAFFGWNIVKESYVTGTDR